LFSYFAPKKGVLVKFKIVQGNIANIGPADALVTLINASGDWYGGVDYSIRSVANKHYHSVPDGYLVEGLTNKQVVIAKGDMFNHAGLFNDVIFIVDEVVSPVEELMTLALETARDKEYAVITVPVMRTGVMLGVLREEPDLNTTIQGIAKAFNAFSKSHEQLNLTVIFVVYNNPAITTILAVNLDS